MKNIKIFYLKNELNELHENELVIVFNEFGDEIISGYLRKECDKIYVEGDNDIYMRIDDLSYEFYVMKRTSIDIIHNL